MTNHPEENCPSAECPEHGTVDPFDEKAAELLPCNGVMPTLDGQLRQCEAWTGTGHKHLPDCASHYRGRVAAALREVDQAARAEGYAAGITSAEKRVEQFSRSCRRVDVVIAIRALLPASQEGE